MSMPSPDARPTLQVTVEAVAWVTRFVGGDGSRRQTFAEAARPGDTVRAVLRRLSARFPRLQEALWDPRSGELGEHIEVLVNDAVLGVAHSLDSPVQDGDRITLIGQYVGGSAVLPGRPPRLPRLPALLDSYRWGPTIPEADPPRDGWGGAGDRERARARKETAWNSCGTCSTGSTM